MKKAIGILLILVGAAIVVRPWITSRGRKVSNEEFERARGQFMIGSITAAIGIYLLI